MFPSTEVRRGESLQESLSTHKWPGGWKKNISFTERGPCLACSLLCLSHLVGDVAHRRSLVDTEEHINKLGLCSLSLPCLFSWTGVLLQFRGVLSQFLGIIWEFSKELSSCLEQSHTEICAFLKVFTCIFSPSAIPVKF